MGVLLVSLLFLAVAPAHAKKAAPPAAPKVVLAPAAPVAGPPHSLCEAAGRHTGRPYVWGATGLKSFDCSGYVWRSCLDNGLLLKRTTARKLYLSLPAVPDSERYRADNLVFFDNLKHVGIVHDDSTFYQAQSSIGTNLSRFDPYWRRKIYGFRRIRLP